jgi:hypothetical protein
MKNIRQNPGDSLRPDYKRSDFGEMVQGKFAATQLEFAELVRMLLACIGEDEGIKFVHHLVGNYRVGRQDGDWTYELDNSNQITLRYWTSEFGSIEEQISNPPCISNASERSELQDLLLTHVRALKAKVQ